MFASIGFGWPLGVTLASLGAVVISSALFALLFCCKRPQPYIAWHSRIHPNDIAEKTRLEVVKANYEVAVFRRNAYLKKKLRLQRKMVANQRMTKRLYNELRETHSASDLETKQKRKELKNGIAELKTKYRELERELAEHERLS